MVERFPEHLEMRKLTGYEWELLRDFVYVSPRWGTLVVPAGFVTDLASVPAFGRWYVSRDGDHLKPAIIHDFGYVKECESAPGPWARMDRRDVDKLFLEAMLVRGIRPTQARVIYAAVRIGGERTFRDD